MRTFFLSMLLIVAAPWAQAADEALTAEEIMRRVAENQERAVEARERFVFEERIRSRVLRNKTKLRHELVRRYRVTPTADGIDRTLLEERGQQRRDDELEDYKHFEEAKQGLDSVIAESLVESSVRGKSRDGLDEELFPLSAERQSRLTFRLDGVDEYKDRDVYKISFKAQASRDWAGEALIDVEDFQPVVVTSFVEPEIPRWVRWTLGVDVKQIGFKVNYEKFDEGVWFPVTYGGEFKIKIFHFYNRTATVAHLFDGFQRTEVDSEIQFVEAR